MATINTEGYTEMVVFANEREARLYSYQVGDIILYCNKLHVITRIIIHDRYNESDWQYTSLITYPPCGLENGIWGFKQTIKMVI